MTVTKYVVIGAVPKDTDKYFQILHSSRLYDSEEACSLDCGKLPEGRSIVPITFEQVTKQWEYTKGYSYKITNIS